MPVSGVAFFRCRPLDFGLRAAPARRTSTTRRPVHAGARPAPAWDGAWRQIHSAYPRTPIVKAGKQGQNVSYALGSVL